MKLAENSAGPVGQPNCERVGSATLYALLANLAATGRAAAETLKRDVPYKALVCLFLDGGNDSFNLLAPLEPDEHARYRHVRADLALGREQLLEISDPAAGGRRFGLHPSVPEIRELYQAGKLSFVAMWGRWSSRRRSRASTRSRRGCRSGSIRTRIR